MTSFAKTFLVTCFFPVSVFSTYAQKPNKKDTVYYFVDTTKVPMKDRMVFTEYENPMSYYYIPCKCYTEHSDLVFVKYRNQNKEEIFTKSQLNKLKFIPLKDIIDIGSRFGVDHNDKYIFYFIEPFGKDFIKYQCYLRSYINTNTKG